MKKVLLISGHPHLDQSLANRNVIDALKAHWGDALEVRDLGAMYGAYGPVDVKAEQEVIVRADAIVIQYPMYWYSMPAVLKGYLDDVYAYGFAYGTGGEALKGKLMVVSTTVGADQSAYTKEGLGYTLDEVMTPWKTTAAFVGAKLAKVIAEPSMLYIPGMMDDKAKAAVVARAQAQAKEIIDVIEKN